MNHLEIMQAQAKKRLPQDEHLLFCVPGDYRLTDGVKTVIPMSIMAATEKRVLYLTTGLVGFTMEEFPYERISGISCSKGQKGSTMTIDLWHHSVSLKWSMLGDVTDLVNYARKQIHPFGQSREDQEQPLWKKVNSPSRDGARTNQLMDLSKTPGGRLNKYKK